MRRGVLWDSSAVLALLDAAVIRVLPEEEAQAKAILARHQDKDWSLCDAISFAVLEARGVRTAFTFDQHFRQYERFDILGPDARSKR